MSRPTIAHGRRTGFASLSRGGLDVDSFPMRLFAEGNAKHWNPADIDFTQDARDVAEMTDLERWWTCSLAAQFMAGEESVTQDLQPFVAAMAAEGRFADEVYLTQFVFEEAKHTEAFRRWFDAVGLTDDLHAHVEENPAYLEIFTKHLPESLYALAEDPSPRNQIRASVTYNHIVEGTLALTGYFAWSTVCASRGILPGMQQVIKHIGGDERRHMAWGTFTCRRHVAADDSLWDVVDERMQELLVPAMGVVIGGREGEERPFGIDINEMAEYAMDKVGRRLGAIESARGADVRVIDRDAAPEELEETFHAEDQAVLAAVV
ncbi:ribonucleoside-diphosphate reductase beta chain [Pseudonocardia thermophila]|jgi:Ribonucleotide reductase, beta subunit|uniref:R2-like ligand binding oxidase n=1 Tax=Pseudonocardia thermophila TaxID=1848 RepID=A0A1M6X8W3_PSETH|nr:R2-like ligand-binding oxidase [Pseudonocardia thermophila]SHL02309.1 ribonucleoside-diphosphate reductase beta chain [Pseudonocardia thermophila]